MSISCISMLFHGILLDTVHWLSMYEFSVNSVLLWLKLNVAVVDWIGFPGLKENQPFLGLWNSFTLKLCCFCFMVFLHSLHYVLCFFFSNYIFFFFLVLIFVIVLLIDSGCLSVLYFHCNVTFLCLLLFLASFITFFCLFFIEFYYLLLFGFCRIYEKIEVTEWLMLFYSILLDLCCLIITYIAYLGISWNQSDKSTVIINKL